MKKKCISLFAIGLALSVLAGCQQSGPAIGSSAPDVSNARTEYLASVSVKKTKDISQVIAFMDTLQKITGNKNLKKYETSYDPQTETVYVTTAKANIAFHLDESGNVMFASANGDPTTKAALSQAITKVYMGSRITSAVDSVIAKAEETRWLNEINTQVAQATLMTLPETDVASLLKLPELTAPTVTTTTNVGVAISDDVVQLITDAFTLKMPNLNAYAKTDLEHALEGGLEMPKFTDYLTEYGASDLTNYYEAPSVAEFWKGIDMSGVQREIDNLNQSGISLKNSFDGLKLENPELDVPTWTLKGYSLPSKFSDGTSTNSMGQATLNAFNGFQSSLDSYATSLAQKEVEERLKAAEEYNRANASGNQAVTDKINQNNTNISAIEQTNQNTTDNKNASAAQSESSKPNIQGIYNSNKNQSQQASQSTNQQGQQRLDGINSAMQNSGLYDTNSSLKQGFDDGLQKATDGYNSTVEDYNNGIGFVDTFIQSGKNANPNSDGTKFEGTSQEFNPGSTYLTGGN